MSKENLARIEASEPRRADRPSSLRMREIYVDEEAFQWRTPEFNCIESDVHTRTLTRVLQDTGTPFDPVLVVPIGSRFYLVDGHHRLNAYRRAHWKKPIPVTIFEGTLDEACIQALSGNIRDKLSMSGPEKREAAWKLVKEGKLSKSSIVKLGAASEGTVSNMRKVLKELKAKKVDTGRLSWMAARMLGSEFEPLDPDCWVEKKAQELANALLKAKIGQGLMKNPEVTARALQKLNSRLPIALMLEWWRGDPDIQSELQKELLDDVYGEPLEDPAGWDEDADVL